MKIDKPKFKVSRSGLDSLLAAMDRDRAQKAVLEVNLRTVKAEVDDAMGQIEPHDLDVIALLSAKRTQLDLYPAAIRRATEKIEKTYRTQLRDEATRFEYALRDELRALAERRRAAIAEFIAPVFPGEVGGFGGSAPVSRAFTVAGESPLYSNILQLEQRVDSSRHDEAAEADHWEVELPVAVRELLAMFEEAKSL